MSEPAIASDADFRARLGGQLVTWASLGVISLGAIVLLAAGIAQYQDAKSTALKDAAQLIFTAILPLLGTWVGTVLAYYYSRENFESASRITVAAVRSGAQQLASTRVADKMMPAASIVKAAIPTGKAIDDLLLKDIGDIFDKSLPNGQKISRLLVVDEKGACIAIIHRSIWMEMIVASTKPGAAVDLTTDSLAKLLEQPYASPVGTKFREFVTNTLAYIAPDRTFADAKAAMEAKPQCQDIIVTATGNSTEPMQGWVSNVDIARLSQA